MKDNYLLLLLGSSVDIFYQASSYPSEGSYTHAKFIGNFAGGPPLNVGCVAASKSVNVKAIDLLKENDSQTDFLLNHLQKNNIDISNIQFDKDAVNGSVVVITTNENRTMFVVDPVRKPYTIDEKLQDLLNNATYIYGLMHIVNRCFDSLEPLLEAKRHGAKVCLDGSSKYDDPSREEILYKLADGLFINTESYQDLKNISGFDPKEKIFANNGEFVCVTDGANGAKCYTKDFCYQSDALKVDVIDSTGAGDSFAGAFIASLLKKYDYQKALRLASASGAYCCTKVGGCSAVCSEEELINFAKKHNFDI